jgi:hypothetical protein
MEINIEAKIINKTENQKINPFFSFKNIVASMEVNTISKFNNSEALDEKDTDRPFKKRTGAIIPPHSIMKNNLNKSSLPILSSLFLKIRPTNKRNREAEIDEKPAIKYGLKKVSIYLENGVAIEKVIAIIKAIKYAF